MNSARTIDEYFREYGRFHVQKAADLLSPLHVPGRDPLLSWDGMRRKPFEPQAHVIQATIAMLDASRRGIIAAEMGTGKTLMGMLAIHGHASRSVNKGGRRGNYRAVVLCPDHLISKWKEEIEVTIPGAKVTIFDAERKGCKQLIPDMLAIYTRIRGRRGRWARPEGAEWYILGRDQAKLLPTRSTLGNTRTDMAGKPWENGSSTQKIRRWEDQNGMPQKELIRGFRCPKCGRVVVDKNGAPLHTPKMKRIMTCEASYMEEIRDPDSRGQGKERIALKRSDSTPDPGRVVVKGEKRYIVRVCGEPLWQFTRKPKRWPPAIFFATKLSRAFHYLVVDEVHEQKSDETAQAAAFGKLLCSIPYGLALTGTLIGGKATDLFPILMRMQARKLIDQGYEWGKQLPFARQYGRIERIVTEDQPTGFAATSSRAQSMRRERDRQVREKVAPGVMPALFGHHLLDKSIFLSLEDMVSELPPLTEYIGGPPAEDASVDDQHFWEECRLELPEDLRIAYKDLEKTLVTECQKLLMEGNAKLLGTMLATLLAYPDRPYGWDTLGWYQDDTFIPVVQPINFPSDVVYPKEQALLNIVNRELRAGNQTWVYVQMTDKRDIQPRLRDIIENQGATVSILRSKQVDPRDRLDWIDRMGKDSNVIISHPQLVQTGIDFFNKAHTHNFSTIAFYQTGTRLPVMRQASRRAWRIGQDKDCRVYYLFYAGTMQERMMVLAARKMAAAMALDGQLNVDGLTALADDGSDAMALARTISENIADGDIQRNWTKVSGGRRPVEPLILLGEQSLRENPLDGIDLLSFDQSLLAQTMLDHGSTLSRDEMSKLCSDLLADDDFSELMEFAL